MRSFSRIMKPNKVSRQSSVSWSALVRLPTRCPLVVTPTNRMSMTHSVPLRRLTLASKHLHSWWNLKTGVKRRNSSNNRVTTTGKKREKKENSHTKHMTKCLWLFLFFPPSALNNLAETLPPTPRKPWAEKSGLRGNLFRTTHWRMIHVKIDVTFNIFFTNQCFRS